MEGIELYMTEEEIVRDYREARDKSAQIKILAQRNLCAPLQIAQLLQEKGEALTAFWRTRVAGQHGQGDPQNRRPSSYWRSTREKLPAKFKPMIVSWGANADAVLGCAVWDGEIWHRDGFKVEPPDFWMPFPKPPHVEKGAAG